MTSRLAALLAAALACPATALAEDDASGPVEFDAIYTGEVWRSEGGVREGWRYLDNLDITLAADLDAAAGIPNTRAFAYVLYNNGQSLTDLTGDAFAVSNIETGVRALRLYEAWIEHDFAPGASLRAGLYDLNSEFDALETSSLFIGSAHGIGADISQSGENGPSIFPITSLAARLAVSPAENLVLRAAVLDAVPGDPARPKRTAIDLGDGALAIAEAHWSFGPARVLAGVWGYDRSQDRLDGAGSAASQGAYLRGEVCLVSASVCALSGFARFGVASQGPNPFDRFASAGVVWRPAPAIEAGLAIAHAAGDPAAQIDPDAVFEETAIELTVAFRLGERIVLQPDVQWVTSRTVAGWREGAVFGLRFSIAAF